MTIAELGAIGELVGGLAVLVTLICLTVQVRSSKRSTNFLIVAALRWNPTPNDCQERAS